MRTSLRIVSALILVGIGMIACRDVTPPDSALPTFGKAKGTEKVTICHGLNTITIGAPALAAHLAHGDTEGPCGPTCVDAPPGLVAWWPGDGNTTDVIGGHNGALVNGATFGPGMVGQAFSFEAANGQYVSVPDDPAWTLGDDPFTIDAWVNFTTVPPRAAIVDHNEGPGSTNKWIFWYDDSGHRAPGGNALRFHINSRTIGALDPVVYPWTPVPGQWYHVAVTRDGSSYALYVDGVEVIVEVDANTIPDANTPLSIGQSELSYFFDGFIDEVEIFDRALSEAEIASIVDAGSAGKCKP